MLQTNGGQVRPDSENLGEKEAPRAYVTTTKTFCSQAGLLFPLKYSLVVDFLLSEY
jgi:hypothetical protein